MRAAHPDDRRAQVVEALLGERGGDLRAGAGEGGIHLADHRAPGAAHRLADRLHVERRERPRVHHLDVVALVFQRDARLQRARHHAADGDHGRVLALALDVRLAEGDDIVLLRHLALAHIERLVFEEGDRVGAADRGLHQALGVIGRAGRRHLEARHMHEPGFHDLRMLGRDQPGGAAGQADDDGHARLSAGHVAHLGGLVDDLVHRAGDEIDIHDLDHRAHAGERGAHAEADNARLRDGGLEDAVRPLVHDALGDGIGAAMGDHVLADDEHALVAGHFLMQRFPERVAERDGPHAETLHSVSSTSVSTSSGSGSGLSSA